MSKECVHCYDELVDEEDIYNVDGREMCEGCFEEGYTPCEDCDEVHDNDDMTYISSKNKYVCEGCLEVDYVWVECCSTYVYTEDALYTEDSSEVYCSIDCLNMDDGFICDDCNGVFSHSSLGYVDDYGDPYCSECAEYRRPNIRSYNDDPPITFFGSPSNNRYFGVELELDKGDAYGFSDDINEHTDERLYLMEDGSLDDGVEVISQPMSLDLHLNGGMWEDVRTYALANRLESHNAFTCGLHVHVSRKGLKASNEGISVEDNIVYIVERFWQKMVAFSRRTNNQLNQWADRHIYEKESDLILLEDVKKARKGGRYRAVNINPTNTIEFRFFRGTLKLETLYASLELVNHICNVAEQLSEKELDDLTWYDFIEMAKKGNYEYLFDYLEEREIMPIEDECKAIKSLRETVIINSVIERAKAIIDNIYVEKLGYDHEFMQYITDALNNNEHEYLYEGRHCNIDEGSLVTLFNVEDNPCGSGGRMDYEAIATVDTIRYDEDYRGVDHIAITNYNGYEGRYASPLQDLVKMHPNFGVISIETSLNGTIVPEYIGNNHRMGYLVLVTEATKRDNRFININNALLISYENVKSITYNPLNTDEFDSLKGAIYKLCDDKNVDALEKAINRYNLLGFEAVKNYVMSIEPTFNSIQSEAEVEEDSEDEIDTMCNDSSSDRDSVDSATYTFQIPSHPQWNRISLEYNTSFYNASNGYGGGLITISSSNNNDDENDTIMF